MELLQLTDYCVGSQCIVCSSGTFNSYIDLTLVSSRTSHSETPLKEKVKFILSGKWISAMSDSSFRLCLPCFHLIDQYDNLETQLRILQEKICTSYVNSHTIFQPHERLAVSQQCDGNGVNGGRTKCSTSSKRMSSKRNKVSSECNISTLHAQIVQLEPETKKERTSMPAVVQWQAAPVAAYETVVTGEPMLMTGRSVDGVLPVSWAAEVGAEPCTAIRILTLEASAAATAPQAADRAEGVSQITIHSAPSTVTSSFHQSIFPAADAEPLTSPAVYDDALEQLEPGQRVLVGAARPAGAFACCYCPGEFGDATTLRQHARAAHRPVVLTANVPSHLGLGANANCGVQMADVTATGNHARPFVCIFCDDAFKSKSNIRLHYKEKHTPHKPFSCPECQETFRRSMELSRHRVYHCFHRKKSRPGLEAKYIR